MQLTEQDIQERVERSRSLREQGFNCSQAVFAACADLYGLDRETALRISASLGGGIGQMRHTCGAACGIFLLAGLENGNIKPNQPDAKQVNYCLVQRLAHDFEQTHGALNCSELLGLSGSAPKQKMPCKQMIMQAVHQYLTTINQQS